ncbi:MAG TPA: GNAT family N-acetyltransferase [Ktedonobacterales bacterium]|jgi:GNAT superfamily N-acetyltransferase|nr:GNAT family N-acetyltransferase [Ktedonobacterales bacterium]
MSITIRKGQPSDLDAICDCVIAAYTPYVARIGRRPAPMDDDYEALLQAGEVYVAPDAAGVRAVLVVRPLETALLIKNVAVHPAYQGLGIGGALLRFAEQLAAQQEISSTVLYTNVLMAENVAV